MVNAVGPDTIRLAPPLILTKGQAAEFTAALPARWLIVQMFTGRLNLPLVLLTGQLKLRGNLRLFPRFGSLFSVDARS